jgi:hypothetical protein
VIIYSLFAIPISNSLAKRYGMEWNNERVDLGIFPITKNWTLDSIVLQSPVRGGMCDLVVTDKTDYRFLENKWYCQYWSNRNVDKSKPYHKSKRIYFTKSFWITKNEIDFEYDTFINPNSELADYEELKVSAHWSSKEIYGHLAQMKNGVDIFTDFDVNQSMYGFEKLKVDRILTKWTLK